MGEMTTHERMRRMYEHREADRVPITDWFWESTAERWHREGMPGDIGLDEYFGLDLVPMMGVGDVDTSPRFPRVVVEETDTYRIERNKWGVTTKNFKPISSTPQDLAFEITDRESWLKIRPSMVPAPDRINWARLQADYKGWRQRGAWIVVGPWFGYDTINARMCGTERIITAMVDDPEWVLDMFNTQCDLALGLAEMIWQAGYTFDEFLFFDDIAYRNGLFFSPRIYHEMVKPYHQRTIDWAHARGIKAHLHCCGNINALVQELTDMGLDALNPLEVKAGMDPICLKRTFGDKLVLRGGFDTRNWATTEAVEADIRCNLPALKESGGYIFASDHSVPHTVSLQTYKRIVQLVKEVGAY